jgi:hypothetical protein
MRGEDLMVDKNATLVLYASNIKEEEFEREAVRFAKFHKLPAESVVAVDCSKPLWRRRKQVLDALKAREGLTTIAMFCHGWPRRIQFGFNLENINDLVAAIDDALHEDPHRARNIILYACSCGRRPGLDPKKRIYFPDYYVAEGSFAQKLAFHATGQRYLTVWSHYNSGHTSRNPFVLTSEEYGVTEWAVEPYHKDWTKWKAKMKTNYRFKFFEEVI